MSGHQSYQLYAHIVWHTWRRVGCIDTVAVDEVRAAIEDACLRVGVHCLRLAVLTDHVHLLVSFRPTTRISDLVRLCKSGSSYRVGKRAAGAIKWCRGYHVASVGKNELYRVEDYLSRQFRHHPDLVPKQSGAGMSGPASDGSS